MSTRNTLVSQGARPLAEHEPGVVQQRAAADELARDAEDEQHQRDRGARLQNAKTRRGGRLFGRAQSATTTTLATRSGKKDAERRSRS